MGSLQVVYRPSTLKNFAGNEDIKKSIHPVLKRKVPPSAFLLVGPSGCGKTTLGRIIARMLGCAKSSFKEMNSSNDRTIAAIRKVIEQSQYLPLKGDKKVILFDEAHSITPAAQEALLKALEEPPAHVHYIVCTTNPEALKDTFKRRCHIYEVSLLTSNELMRLMRKILSAEKIKDFPNEILDRIIELSGGSAGIALKNLDTVIDMKDDVKGAIAALKSSGTSEADIRPICQALLNFNMNEKARWIRVKKLLKNYRGDGESARRKILGYMEKVLLNKGMFETILIMDEFKGNFYDSGKAGLAMACFKACFIGDEDE